MPSLLALACAIAGALAIVPAASAAALTPTVVVDYNPYPTWAITPSTLTGAAVGDTFQVQNNRNNDAGLSHIAIVNDTGRVSMGGYECFTDIECHVADSLGTPNVGTLTIIALGTVRIVRHLHNGGDTTIGTLTLSGSAPTPDPTPTSTPAATSTTAAPATTAKSPLTIAVERARLDPEPTSETQCVKTLDQLRSEFLLRSSRLGRSIRPRTVNDVSLVNQVSCITTSGKTSARLRPTTRMIDTSVLFSDGSTMSFSFAEATQAMTVSTVSWDAPADAPKGTTYVVHVRTAAPAATPATGGVSGLPAGDGSVWTTFDAGTERSFSLAGAAAFEVYVTSSAGHTSRTVAVEAMPGASFTTASGSLIVAFTFTKRQQVTYEIVDSYLVKTTKRGDRRSAAICSGRSVVRNATRVSATCELTAAGRARLSRGPVLVRTRAAVRVGKATYASYSYRVLYQRPSGSGSVPSVTG